LTGKKGGYLIEPYSIFSWTKKPEKQASQMMRAAKALSFALLHAPAAARAEQFGTKPDAHPDR
jgi:hypothetical protein